MDYICNYSFCLVCSVLFNRTGMLMSSHGAAAAMAMNFKCRRGTPKSPPVWLGKIKNQPCLDVNYAFGTTPLAKCLAYRSHACPLPPPPQIASFPSVHQYHLCSDHGG